MLREFLKRLNQPFPSQESFIKSVRSFIAVGAFIALFLYLFKPFGLHNVEDQALRISASYGLVTFAFGLGFDLFTRTVLRLKTDVPSWTLWKWILLSMALLCWIAFGNFLLTIYDNGWNFANLSVGLSTLKYTVMLGLLPVFASGMFIQLNAIKINQSHAQALLVQERSFDQINNDAGSEQAVFNLSATEQFAINPADVLFVEAMQNYVMVHYRIKGENRTQMIRSTIADALAVFKGCEKTDIIRCHRSYLVNMMAVDDISGNAQGLKLTLAQAEGSLLTLPVSRSYIADFKISIEGVSR